MNFSRLIWREPWLAPVVLCLQSVIETEAIETAAVTPNGRVLYFNPQFWKSLTDEERLGVQLHEMLHIINLHAARCDDRNHILWNYACDMAINQSITDAGYRLPPRVLDGYPRAAEIIYKGLIRDEIKATADHGRISFIFVKTPSKDNPTPQMAGDLQEKNIDGSCDGPDADAIDAFENAAQLAGKYVSPLSRSFVPTPPSVNWRTVLRGFIKSICGDALDYIDYVFEDGVCEDVLTEVPRPKLCLLVDESGSIEDDLYCRFLGEMQSIGRVAEVWVSGFTDGTDLNVVPLSQYTRTMTGGTNVIPAYTQACKKDFDGILILTDGELDFPLKEPQPTVWVMPHQRGRKMEVIL